ncbi:hypothetical protein ABZX69_20505 [Streptomyces sp. NPDC004074]|uniref:hypothetical protein n=1 Tax=Streptomyces sp. NPDC004074 TaxID=3154277 RepID=UPI0033A17BAD
MSDHDIGWISSLIGEGGAITFVRGVTHAELAWMIAPEHGTVMTPEVFRQVKENSHGVGSLPDHAVIGETGTGWAFAVEPPWCPTEWYRYDYARRMWSSITGIEISDNGMDPPTIGVSVDGKHNWSYFEGEVGDGQEDHPLTRRLAAEAGLRKVISDLDDPDDCELVIPEEETVYRIMGEHFGLALPREAIETEQMPVVFTEPRIFRHQVRKGPDGPYDPCPECGAEMVKWNGDGIWGPQYRLSCSRAESHGCSGGRLGPLIQIGVREEHNTKWDNVRMSD